MSNPRLTRLELLVGEGGIDRLARAHVCVVGLGGVGGSCALALARSGVGCLTLVDGDVVEPGDFNRQAIAFDSLLGMPKPEACAKLIADINPDIRVRCVNEMLTPESAEEVLPLTCDYVVDCIDDLPVKVALAKLADERGFPLVSSMGTARKWRPDLLRFTDIYGTRGCPVAKIMRRELKRAGVTGLDVLYSEELPAPQLSEEPRPLGSNAIVPPIAGTMLAGFVMQKLLGLK